jgi:hypothetical protein
MFCPYRFAHALGHINLISTQWMVLYILFMIRMINEDKRSNALLASLFLILTVTSYGTTSYIYLYSPLYLLFTIKERINCYAKWCDNASAASLWLCSLPSVENFNSGSMKLWKSGTAIDEASLVEIHVLIVPLHYFNIMEHDDNKISRTTIAVQIYI